MKKRKCLVMFIILLLIPAFNVYASSASISCSSSGTVTVGNRITVTFSGNYSGNNRDMLIWKASGVEWTSSKLNSNFQNTTISEDGNFSKSYSFTATNVGTATVRLVNVDVADGYQLIGPGGASNSCTINIVSPTLNSNSHTSSSSSSSTSSKKNIDNKSSDNSLKSLEIEGTKFDFNKDTLEYNVEVLSDEKTKINVKAEANDKTAKISGTGEKEVDLGINKIEVNVTAENGSVRTYVLNVTVSEKNPIIVKIDVKKYKILRKIDGIDMPDGYEKKSIKIKNKDVEVYYSSKTKYTLVALTNDNVTSLFIYKNNKYTRYSELTNSSLRLLVQKPNNKDIPYKYKKCTFNIDNNIVDGYELSSDSRFKLVYALNLDTNEKSFYLYDLDEKTFQRFYDEQVLIYIELVKKFKVGIVILGGLFAVLLMTIVCLFSVNHKTKKRINNYSLNEQKINKKEKTF